MSAASAPGPWDGLDALPDAVVVVDAARRIRHANPAAARLAGVEVADLVGADAAAALPLADAAGRDWWVCARPLEADPTVAARVPQTDLTLFPGGRARPVALTAARRGRGAAAVLVLCLRRAESRRRRDVREAELVAVLAHDLRAPLTTVKGFAKTMLSRDDRLSRDQRRDMLRAVLADADRLDRLIDEAVDALRLHADRLGLRRAPAESTALISRAVAGLAGDRRTRVRATLPPAGVALVADAARLEAAVATMLETALSGDGFVDLVGETDGAVLRLRATAAHADPPTAPAALFGPRPGADRDAIRRWVARGVLRAHGGRIEAAALPDGGLVVSLTVPLDPGGFTHTGSTKPAGTRRAAQRREAE